MARQSFTAALARRSARHPWRTIGLWAMGLAVSLAAASQLLGSSLSGGADFTNSPESKQAEQLLQQGIRDQRQSREVVIVRSSVLTVDEPEFQLFVGRLFESFAALGPGVIQEKTAATFYLTGDPSLVSPDRHTTLIPFVLAGDRKDAAGRVGLVKDAIGKVDGGQQFQVLLTGPSTVSHETKAAAEDDLKQGEGVGVLLGLVVLVLVFGAVAAALLPIVIGAVSIVVAIGLAAVVGQGLQLSFFITNTITMIGLAVGIDYALFIVARYREERRAGVEKCEAIVRAGSTAGRAVLFSGITVVLALAGMMLVPTTIFQSLGLGAILVVLVAVLASITLLPAVLSIMGDRVDRLRVPRLPWTHRRGTENAAGLWELSAAVVMRHPLVSVALAAGVLLAAASPLLDLNTGVSGVSSLPDGLASKQGFQILDREFSAGRVTPADIVISGDIASGPVQASIRRLTSALAQDPAFAPPLPIQTNASGDVALLSVPVNGDADGGAQIEAVKRLRSQVIPEAFAGTEASVLVGGETAYTVDFLDLTGSRTPLVFAFVLGLSFLLLMVVFRSLVVPVKAILLNLLSVSAAYGLLVLVFQKGVAAGLLGFQQVEAIEAWVPLFLFSILFGLSMDYHVFMLSRIRERFDQTRDNAGSVAFGLCSTNRLITGAALIMVSVFGGFASGSLVPLQQIGFGLGVAILLDATVVRSVLVPASMKLLGNVNWYFPSFLRWLPDLRVKAQVAPETPAPRREARASAAACR